MDLPVCYTPLWVSPSDKPVDDRLVTSCQVLRYQYIYYMPLWAHMQVRSSDILMSEDDIWLVAVSHLAHILPGYHHQLFIRQYIFRMGIERHVENSVTCIAVRSQIWLKRGHAVPDSRCSTGRFHDPVSCQYPCLFFFYFFFIVGEYPIGGSAFSDVGNHIVSSLNDWVSLIIVRLTSTSCRVSSSSR